MIRYFYLSRGEHTGYTCSFEFLQDLTRLLNDKPLYVWVCCRDHAMAARCPECPLDVEYPHR